MGGSISGGVHRRLGGGHPETSRLSHSIDPLSGCEESSPAKQDEVVDYGPSACGAPPVPVLGAGTVAHTSRGSPYVDVLPPDEGVVLADVDSAGMRFASGSQVSGRSRMDVDGSRMGCVVELCLLGGHSFLGLYSSD